MGCDFNEIIYTQLKNENKQKCHLDQRDYLLKELSHMETLITGRLDVFFCNQFLNESVQLLINSVFLMEEGYFDCAFYSIRQSSENLNNMLLVASDRSKLQIWENKDRFPTNKKVLDTLTALDLNYKEIREKLSDFFEDFENLIAKSHKIIHKQGFDTFYKARTFDSNQSKYDKEDEIDFFIKLLKYSICKVYLIFMILDPIGLVLADEQMDKKFNFNPITDAVNLTFIEDNCQYNIIERLRETDFYKKLVNWYCDKEEMNEDTYNVVREQFFNIQRLDNIQQHLLNYHEQFILSILKLGFQVSNFHIGGISILPYWTNLRSNYERYSWSSNEFDKFAGGEAFNNAYNGVYISRISMLDEVLFLEHNEQFSNEEILLLIVLSNKLNDQYRKMNMGED